MKAIILAAGKGTRLDGAAVKPKCLVEVGGMTLLRRQIESLKSVNINRIVIVVGFGADNIREECGGEVDFVENTRFAETSSLYSLWLAREHLADGFVVLNCDVLFHPQLLADLIDSTHEDALLLSDSDPHPLGDEEMKVKLKDGFVTDISKAMDPLEADGENVGIVKFSGRGESSRWLHGPTDRRWCGERLGATRVSGVCVASSALRAEHAWSSVDRDRLSPRLPASGE